MSYLLNSINKSNQTFANAGDYAKQSDVAMFTGFTLLDLVSSNTEEHISKNVTLMNGGLFNNPYSSIGISASGKTTLWIQIISSCMDYWWNNYGPVSECTFYNVENHTSATRWKTITGYTNQMMMDRVRFINKSLSINEIFADIAVLAREKVKHKKELEIDTGILSISGESKKVLPTSYVLIDSIASVRVETELQFDKDGNLKSDKGVAGTSNMDAMQAAKDNTIFINEVKKLCEQANICVVMVNHLVDVPVLDRYNPPKPILPSMKFNQKLKGGNELIYQSFGVYQLELKERMFNEKNQYYGPNIHGIVANMKILKNKNGPESIVYPMVFDSATGYKPELSDFEILYNGGLYGMSGSPASYRLDILPEISFTRKNLLDTCYENPLLARAIAFTTRIKLYHEIILRTEAPSLKDYLDLPYEQRVFLILHYTVQYPGYDNFGRFVKEEDQRIHDMYTDSLGMDYFINQAFTEYDYEYYRCSQGEFIFMDQDIDYSNCEVIKGGGEEYLFPLYG